jgi:hypothetical protein
MVCAATAAQSRAQALEVRELAELRRQRAVQGIRPHAPATARGTASVPRGEYPSPHWYPRLLHMVPQHPVVRIILPPRRGTYKYVGEHAPHAACPPRALKYPFRPPSRLRPPSLASSPTAVPGATPQSTARSILFLTGVPGSSVVVPTPARQCARRRPDAERGAYKKVSFASEPIQLPIVPLSVFL